MAHLAAVVRWLQEAAVADGIDAGLLHQSAWIIRRTTLRVERMPAFSEQLELETWCSGLTKSVAARSTAIRGDLGAAIEAEALWVHVDPQARRPARLPAAFHEIYAESAAGRRPRASLRHPPSPPAGAKELSWTFARADVDLAGHVNNAAYWRIAEEYFDLSRLGERPASLEAEYRSGIGPGPAHVHRSGEALWVGAADGAIAATLRLTVPARFDGEVGERTPAEGA